jgi:HEAT repeat protein
MKNDMGGELMEAGQALTADQEAIFKAGLDHEFNYQRYKTILDLSAARAPGSEEMLREALESKKFWTRMRAVIALADMGAELTDEDIKQALGPSHSELRANFFKRFEKSTCTVGCYFVARASLPHLDAAGRAQVIRVISREPSDIRDAYLVAATKDQSPTVRKEAEAWLAEHAVDQAVYDDIKRIYGAPN